MKKCIMASVCGLLISVLAIGQRADVNVNYESRTKVRPVSKTENPTTDQVDQFEIQGLGATTFYTSNTYDGSGSSYMHSLRIDVTMVVANKPGNNFKLIFYSEPREFPQAASYTSGALNIYYPISFYESIKQKFDQAIASKKKVYVKVTQKTDGYREGVLIF